MKGLHFNGVQDVLALLVRRKWWVVLPFFALSSATLLLTEMLPRLYVSEALVLIRPRDVPEAFVPNLIAGNTEQRLIAIQQTVLSRTNLIRILHQFEDNLPEYRTLNIDQQVVQLNSQIAIQLDGRGYIRISYQNRNPYLAQKIADKLTSLFIEEDSKTREVQVNGTTDFMSTEVGKIADQLKESDDQLKQLKAARRDTLPDQRETNLRALDRLSAQKQGIEEAIDRNNTMQISVEQLMAETEPTIQKPVPQVAVAKPKNNPVDEDLQRKLDLYQRKKAELEDLSLRYTPEHPDVKQAKVQLERLKNEIPPEGLALLDKKKENTTEAEATPPPAPIPTAPNPAYESLRIQLDGLKTEAAIHEKERRHNEEETQKYLQRVEATPQTEQDLSDVLRQNADLMKQHDKLKSDLTQAQLSESLESKQKGSQIVIVDKANLPIAPTKPSKPKIALGGLAFSLLVGLALAVGSDLAGQKVWSQAEIESLLGASVLVEIPQIVTDADIAAERKKKMVFVTSVLAGGAAYGVALYFAYVHSAGVLQRLDPILQKLYS
jgi:polysaccharide chain length determinant protein (PEP-CTERM system associated)